MCIASLYCNVSSFAAASQTVLGKTNETPCIILHLPPPLNNVGCFLNFLPGLKIHPPSYFFIFGLAHRTICTGQVIRWFFDQTCNLSIRKETKLLYFLYRGSIMVQFLNFYRTTRACSFESSTMLRNSTLTFSKKNPGVIQAFALAISWLSLHKFHFTLAVARVKRNIR